jgi:ABC-type protease/lipase transport system fused ATPase/permease subunit
LLAVDLVAVIQNGRVTAFGPKDEIIGSQRGHAVAPAPADRPQPRVNARVLA